VRLSRSARQALAAALEMARAGGAWVPVAEVARARGIPESALAKVFQRLVRAGLAVGTRGVGGGYRLARDASEVTVADVLAVFEPPPAAPGLPPADPVEARLRALLAEVDESARATFASVSLATLARPVPPPARDIPHRAASA
jgi:Rrf2 family protein